MAASCSRTSVPSKSASSIIQPGSWPLSRSLRQDGQFIDVIGKRAPIEATKDSDVFEPGILEQTRQVLGIEIGKFEALQEDGLQRSRSVEPFIPMTRVHELSNGIVRVRFRAEQHAAVV